MWVYLDDLRDTFLFRFMFYPLFLIGLLVEKPYFVMWLLYVLNLELRTCCLCLVYIH
jgi:hypothetical protein